MDIEELGRERQRLRERGPAPGRAWCEVWTQAIDRLLVALHDTSVHRDQLTVVATGGYARRELCPQSDIDLLLLHEHLEEPALAVAVREIVYPLWDAGLKVGYAVRDRRQATRVREVEDVTAALDARFVAGSEALSIAVRDQVVRSLPKRGVAFLTSLTAIDRQRHERRGDAAEALEPDLKDGAGGLRDVQSLRWAAAALVGEPTLDALVSAGYLGAGDRTRLAHAYDRLLAERVALQLETSRPTNTLDFELHPVVAARLGYEDGENDRDTASHRLLAAHFLAARVVEHVHRRAWSLVRADLDRGRRRRRRPTSTVEGFAVADGVLDVPAGFDPGETADAATHLFEVLATNRLVLSRAAAQRLRRTVQARDEPLSWTDRSRQRFLRTLWLGAPAFEAATELDDVGLLTALIPEWEPIRGRPQRNPYHRYSLDRHALHAATGLGDLVRHEEWAATTLEEVEDRDALMIGLLLHDIGKAHGEPHSQTGRPVARTICRRLGLDASSTALVDRLVELHLLVPTTATRRDLDDANVIESVAREVGDRQTLASLHLLAAADGQATGPTAWGTWTASLVEVLVARVRAALDRDASNDLADRARATASQAQRSAGSSERGEMVRRHLAALPMRYATAVPPEVVVRHAEMAETLVPSDIAVDVLPSKDVARLLVVTRDRPGLLALVAGSVTVSRASVLEAHAHTRTDGLAVQLFTVAPPSPPDPDWTEALAAEVRRRHADPEGLADEVARRRRNRRPATAGLQIETRVRLEHTSRATVVEIRTHDRPGLLHLAARVLTELGYDVDTVKASVEGTKVTDVFYVSRTDDRPVDADAESELELALLTALAADDVTSPTPPTHDPIM